MQDQAALPVKFHNNHLGATEAVTNEKGAVLWSAQYAPFGRLLPASQRAGFIMNLRLPWQFEDEETELYYNDHRYYDPDTGRYISPDPLGLRGGINSYAYAGGNPLRYVDPSGLLLFAFDGTMNTMNPVEKDGIKDTQSNVAKFFNAYAAKEKYCIDTLAFITDKPGDPDPSDLIEGYVDIIGYCKWLNDNEYFKEKTSCIYAGTPY